MAKKTSKVEEPKELENFENALSSSEAFIEKNQKSLAIIFVVIIAAVAGWLLFQNLYLVPQENEAENMMAQGQKYFSAKQYDLAINGDSVDFIGFANIADEYGMTKSANLAKAYAGISEFKLGNFDSAIEYLSAYKGSDLVLQYTVEGTMGDCYAQKGDLDKAVACFKNAAKSDNVVVATAYLFKIARINESKSDFAGALKIYEDIKANYGNVLHGIADVDDIDKYIDAAKSKIK